MSGFVQVGRPVDDMTIRVISARDQNVRENESSASDGSTSDDFVAVAREHAGAVFAICYSFTGNAADAEELAQETLVRGFRKFGQKRGAHFKPWYFEIARNVCRDHLRRQKRTKEAKQKIADHSTTQTENPLDNTFADLEEALAGMSEQHRMPLLLFYFDGHDAKRIGALLGMSTAAVHKRLSRARAELRKRLEALQSNDQPFTKEDRSS